MPKYCNKDVKGDRDDNKENRFPYLFILTFQK